MSELSRAEQLQLQVAAHAGAHDQLVDDDEPGQHRAESTGLLPMLWRVYGKAIAAGIVGALLYLAGVVDVDAGVLDALAGLSFVELVGVVPAFLAGAGITYAAPARRT